MGVCSSGQGSGSEAEAAVAVIMTERREGGRYKGCWRGRCRVMRKDRRREKGR